MYILQFNGPIKWHDFALYVRVVNMASKICRLLVYVNRWHNACKRVNMIMYNVQSGTDDGLYGMQMGDCISDAERRYGSL